MVCCTNRGISVTKDNSKAKQGMESRGQAQIQDRVLTEEEHKNKNGGLVPIYHSDS